MQKAVKRSAKHGKMHYKTLSFAAQKATNQNEPHKSLTIRP